MSFIGYLISLLITGLIIGGLGRLVVPGRNPMGLGLTMLLGIGGALIGGIIAAAIGAGVFVSLLFEVLVAAALVALVSRNGNRRGLGRPRRRRSMGRL